MKNTYSVLTYVCTYSACVQYTPVKTFQLKMWHGFTKECDYLEQTMYMGWVDLQTYMKGYRGHEVAMLFSFADFQV